MTAVPLAIGDGRRAVGMSLRTMATHPKSPMTELARRGGFVIPDPAAAKPLPEHAVKARVNAGDWIADCPDCGGGEYVYRDELLFMCCHCWNQSIGGAWRPVAMPRTWKAIERVLMARPVPLTRNWRGESIVKLRAENRDRGLPEEV